MRRRALTLAVAVMALGLLAGCGRPSLVGKWTMQNAESAGGLSEMVVHFQEGGAFAAEASAGAGPFKVKGSAKGTYVLEGNKLTVKIASTDFDKLPEEFRQIAENEINRQASRLTGTFRWDSANAFSVGEQDYTVTFERVNR